MQEEQREQMDTEDGHEGDQGFRCKRDGEDKCKKDAGDGHKEEKLSTHNEIKGMEATGVGEDGCLGDGGNGCRRHRCKALTCRHAAAVWVEEHFRLQGKQSRVRGTAGTHGARHCGLGRTLPGQQLSLCFHDGMEQISN